MISQPQASFLQVLFQRVQMRLGIDLSIEEYLMVQRCLELGVGLQDRDQLKRTISRIWLKRVEQIPDFNLCFEEEYELVLSRVSTSNASTAPPKPAPEQPIPEKKKDANPDHPDDEAQGEENESPSPLETDLASREKQATGSQQVYARLSKEDGKQAGQAGGFDPSSTEDSLRQKFIFTNEHLPISFREQVQIWRTLKTQEISRITNKIDIPATVRGCAQAGLLEEVVYEQTKENRTQLIFLLDREGSMRPFHLQCDELVRAARERRTHPNAKVYYFRNLPDAYTYRKKDLTQKVAEGEMFSGSGTNQYCVVLVSDGGAARGAIREDRVRATLKVLLEWPQKNVKLIWLNPMPRYRWPHTSAAYLDALLPKLGMKMFGMDRVELESAVDFLQS